MHSSLNDLYTHPFLNNNSYMCLSLNSSNLFSLNSLYTHPTFLNNSYTHPYLNILHNITTFPPSNIFSFTIQSSNTFPLFSTLFQYDIQFNEYLKNEE